MSPIVTRIAVLEGSLLGETETFTCVRPPFLVETRLYDSATAAFLYRSDGPLGHAVGLWHSCSCCRKPPLARSDCCDQFWRVVTIDVRDLVNRASKVLHCFNGVSWLTLSISGRLQSTSWLYPRRPPRPCRRERPCLQYRLRFLSCDVLSLDLRVLQAVS